MNEDGATRDDNYRENQKYLLQRKLVPVILAY